MRSTKKAAVTGFVAECFWPGVKKNDLVRLDARVQAVAGSGDPLELVHYRGALLLPTDEVVFCFFDGPSAEAVEATARRAKIPFERILPSVRVPSVRRD